MAEKDGGVKQQSRADTRAKYASECREAFGVMVKQLPDGSCVGRRMEPFNYTGHKVVGPATFEKRIQTEVRRVTTLKTTGTSASSH